MSLLDTLRERRAVARARSLGTEGALDDALEAIEDCEGPEAAVLRGDLRREAARLWLGRAAEAAERHDGGTLRRHRARAGRYWFAEIDPWYRRVDRSVRVHQVSVTCPEHWVELVETAAQQSAQWADIEEPTLSSMPAWGTFARRELLKEVARVWGLSRPFPLPDDLERADNDALKQVLPLVKGAYPDDLADAVNRLGAEFVRAVLLLSSGRPDLAALPLVELPEGEPLVCFERARVAHSLGLPRTALVALQGFALRAGGHTRIRRLHTAVFAAQSALACSENEHALELLRRHAPVRQLGGRPLVLTARLLVEAGQAGEARDLLREHLHDQPDHTEARDLLAVLEGQQSDPPDLTATAPQ